MIRTPELLSDPVYHDEEAARVYLQEVRWPDGVFCPFCGTLDDIKPLGGESMGPGWFYCPACQDKFTVRVGSVMERSHIPLHKWLLAFRLMASSKKGISAHQMHRTLGITYKSAWFLAHRIRECMADTDPAPLGGKDKIIEADETYFGRAGDPKDSVFVTGKGWVRRGGDKKMIVATLVERGGKARSVHIDRANANELNAVLRQASAGSSHVYTLRSYTHPKWLVMSFGIGIILGIVGLISLLVSSFIPNTDVVIVAAVFIALGSVTIALALLRGQDLARRARS